MKIKVTEEFFLKFSNIKFHGNRSSHPRAETCGQIDTISFICGHFFFILQKCTVATVETVETINSQIQLDKSGFLSLQSAVLSS
jgi:hypothetical protein